MFRLMVVSDRHRCRQSLVETVRLALEGGADAVQLRERDLEARELYAMAEELREITREANAALIINHRVDVALAVGADGVHLGWRSLLVKDARQVAGDRLKLGISCHSANQLRTAERARADYVLLGPVFPTPSKRGLVEPIGPDAMRGIVAGTRLPVVAIGGITAENIGQVLETGVTGVAAVSAVIAADDPAQAARDMLPS